MITYNLQPPIPENICAIVITYFPDECFLECIASICQQVNEVIIVDNNSSGYCLAMILKISATPRIHIIQNDDNLGIASALNKGIQYARDRGYKWGLTLDQDTVPEKEMIHNLITAYHDTPFKERIGAIGSNYRENNTGREALEKKEYGDQSWLEVNEVITSGCLISIPAFNIVGPFREEFFMYYVDHEYCIRLRMSGYKVIIACKICMTHSTGNCEIKRFLWRNIVAFNYIPQMSYYIVRNGLILVREYIFKETLWAMHRMYVLVRRIISAILFGNNKIQILKYISLGIYHALILRQGKLIS